MKHEMRFKPVGVQAGLRWVQQGFRVFFRQPLAFSVLMLALLVVMILPAVPFVGQVLALMAVPFVTLGFMLGTHQALQGRVPRLNLMLLPFRITRGRSQALLRLGSLYAVATIVGWLLAHWLDGGAFAAFQEALLSGKLTTPEAMEKALAAEGLQRGVLMRLLLLSGLSLVFWFAPPLVHWGGHSAAKALFFSIVACWRNKAAFALYGALWAALGLGGGIFASLVMAVLGPVAQFVLAPLFVTMMGAFYVSLFFTFLDSFSLVPSTRSPSTQAEPTDVQEPPRDA